MLGKPHSPPLEGGCCDSGHSRTLLRGLNVVFRVKCLAPRLPHRKPSLHQSNVIVPPALSLSPFLAQHGFAFPRPSSVAPCPLSPRTFLLLRCVALPSSSRKNIFVVSLSPYLLSSFSISFCNSQGVAHISFLYLFSFSFSFFKKTFIC